MALTLFISSRNLKGIGRVERNIVETLAESTYPHEFIVFLDREPSEIGLPQSDSLSYSVNRSKSLIEWEQVRLNRAARQHKIDCLITLSDRVPLLYSGRIVLYLLICGMPFSQSKERGDPDYRRETPVDVNRVRGSIHNIGSSGGGGAYG